MRMMNQMMGWGILFLFSSSGVLAAEQPSVYGSGHFSASQENIRMVDLNSPKLKLGEMTGTISAYDEVLEKISVQGARGMNMEFVVETNTPITDHNQQIGFADLHVGDQVTVHYNVDPQQVNSIEKI